MGDNMLDYLELFKSGSDPKSFFKLFPEPEFVEHRAKYAQWFGCVLWDDGAWKEFKIHEQMGGTLQTKMFLGRMLRNCIKDPLEGMAEQMKWKKEPFILVDVISDKFGMCGINKCLRVRETPTWNTSGNDGFHELKTWDLVIFPECIELAEEMIRPEYCGVKKTVCIWNAYVAPYPEPWIDCGGDQISGEILLKTTRKMDEKMLTVIIFHHGDLENFKGVPVQNLKIAEEDKIVKLRSENFHHYERMIAKVYPISVPKNHSVAKKTAEESDISCSSFNEENDNGTERSQGESVPIPIPVLRDLVEQLPVNNLEPLKDKLKRLRSERMTSRLDQNQEIESGPLPVNHSEVSEKELEKIAEDLYLSMSTSSTSVDTFDEDSTTGSLDPNQEDVMIIDETDYEKSDAESETISVDVLKEADKEIRKLAEYFLKFRK